MLRSFLNTAIFILGLALCVPVSAGDNRVLTGTVFFRDSIDVPAVFSTVYIPEIKCGTTVSPDGYFSLKIPEDAPSGNVKVEFSCIGYETSVREVSLAGDGDVHMEKLRLNRQTLMLPAAYVLPDNRDPADYILEQVSIRAAENERNFTSYSMDIDYDFHTYELSVAADIVSKFLVGSAKAVAGLAGYGPIVKYALENEDVSASVSFKRTIENGVTTDSDVRLTQSSAELPDKVKKNVLSASGFIDMSGLIYSDNSLWGRNNRKKYKFKLVGSYQSGDYLVDVLKWSDKKKHLSATVHVVEEQWGILKAEVGYDDKMIRCEARDIGGGYFLPVSLTVKPSFFPSIKAEDIPAYIEKIKVDREYDPGTRRRMIRALEKHLDRDFHPYIVCSFSTRYKR